MTGTTTAAAIECENIYKIYSSRSGPVAALQDVSLTIQPRSFTSILGPSGCGKSTLMMIVAGLVESSAGRTLIDGKEVNGPYTDAGIVFQKPVLLEWKNALQNVCIQGMARNIPARTIEERARELLQNVGLDGFESKRPAELSGGMAQRVAICRALVHEPPVLLMDEPFAALDALTRDQIGRDVSALCADRDVSVMFITHSIPEAVFLSDQIVVMSARPGTIDAVIDIDLPKPRTLETRSLPQYDEYIQQIEALFVRQGVLHA